MPKKLLKKLGLDRKQAQAKTKREARSYSIKIQTFIVINVVLFAGLALYTYQNYLKYQNYRAAVTLNSQTIDNLNTTLATVRQDFQKERDSYEEQKTTIEKDLAVIFPSSESYTELTRQLDQFFFSLNSSNPPIIHNNLRFESPQQLEDYYVLPFSMSIQTSKANFNRFLQYIETSGTIGSNIRLMAIESIQINFIEESENNINEFDINFTVNMSAYFQNNQQQ